MAWALLLARAREIQESLLPKSIPQLPGFEIAAAWRPAREVSGDYFDVFPVGDGKLGICIADVVGKGVSAALLMANVQAAVRAFASDRQSPAVVCTKVNRLLCENIATGKFVTFLFAVLDSADGSLAWCNAGHLDPILVSAGSARSLDGGGAVLGVFPEWRYEEEKLDLKNGDRFLLVTDGITEASDASQVEFGEERVANLAERLHLASAEEMNQSLLNEVDRLCGARFEDDATVVLIAAR